MALVVVKLTILLLAREYRKNYQTIDLHGENYKLPEHI